MECPRSPSHPLKQISYLVLLLYLLTTISYSHHPVFAHALIYRIVSTISPVATREPASPPPSRLSADASFTAVGLLDLLLYAWDSSLRYPAHLALVGLGWAMEPFQGDAVDLYLSVGL